MKEIPTAEFFAKNYLKECKEEKVYPLDYYNLAMEFQKFAKLHVEAALREVSEKARAKEDPADCGTGEIWVDKQSILSAYPLTNIK